MPTNLVVEGGSSLAELEHGVHQKIAQVAATTSEGTTWLKDVTNYTGQSL